MHSLTAADGHVLHRNLSFLVSVVQAFPQAQAIAYGALRGEASADKSPAFVRAANRVFRASEGGPRIEAPLLHTTKPAPIPTPPRPHPDSLPPLALPRTCY